MRMRDLERGAFDEAVRLGHHWVGPEHGLLAILKGDPKDVARRALEEAGMDAEGLEQFLEEMSRRYPGDGNAPARTISPTPAWYRVVGRADGFSASLHTGEVLAVHFLLGVLWSDRRLFGQRQGMRREAVVEALRRLGVALPLAPLPSLGQVDFLERVELGFP